MLAAQGVAAHCAILDSLRCAADPNTPPLVAIKYRASAVALNRMFCTNLRELVQLQSRPLPPRPGQPPAAPTPEGDGGDPPPVADTTPVARPRGSRARAKTSPAKVTTNPTVENPQPAADPDCPLPDAPVSLQDMPEMPEDIETRPDGTPGNLTAYAPKPPPPVPYIPPREAPIMVALATRPKPWRMVNVPKDQAPIETADVAADTPAAPLPEPEPLVSRGPVDLRERIFTGDALARFASKRLDPDAPVEPLRFDHEDSMVELELISTGGDPSAEAEQAAMMAAHPEGRPIVTFRHGTKLPPGAPLSNGKDDPPSAG
jgi:hypothetical protein